MGFFTKLFGKKEIEEKNNPAPQAFYHLGGNTREQIRKEETILSSGMSTANPNSAGTTTAFHTSELIYACVDYIAKAASQATPTLYRIDKDGNKKEVKEPELIKWSKAPNPNQSWGELIELITQGLLLNGNSYVTFDKIGTELESWYLYQPHLVDVVINDSDSGVSGYIYNSSIPYKEEELIQFRNASLASPFYGVSPIRALLNTMQLDKASLEELKTFYDGSSLISGLIKSELPLTPDQIESLREQFRDLYGKEGKFKRGTAVLPNKADYVPIQANPRDSMLLDSLKVSEQRIFRAYKIHPVVLGGEITSPTQPQQLMKMVFNTAVRPYLYKIQDKIQQHLNKFYRGLYFEFDLSRVVELDTSLDVKATSARQLYITGITSLNESRELVGLEPLKDVENADKHILAVSIIGEIPHYVENGIPTVEDVTGDVTTNNPTTSDPLGGANDNPLDVDSTSNNVG